MKAINVELLGKSVVVHHRPHGPDGFNVKSRGRFSTISEGAEKGPVVVLANKEGPVRAVPVSTITRIVEA